MHRESIKTRKSEVPAQSRRVAHAGVVTGNFKIIGHDLIATNGEAMGLKTLEMNHVELLDYARVLKSAERKAEDELLKWRVRLGVMLLQVRSQIRHGSWIPWLKQLGLHRRTATMAIRLAPLADQNGELDTARLKRLMVDNETHEQLAGSGEDAEFATEVTDTTHMTLHRVEQMLEIRKTRTRQVVMPPISPEGKAAVKAIGYRPPGENRTAPVVIDGEVVQDGCAFNHPRRSRPLLEHVAHSARPSDGSRSENGNDEYGSSRPVSIGSKIRMAADALRRVLKTMDLGTSFPNDSVADQILQEAETFESRISGLLLT